MGDPLPGWLKLSGKLISGVPPTDIEKLELRIKIRLSNDAVIIRYIDVNLSTGEITPLKKISGVMIAGFSLFEDQIEKEAVKFERHVSDRMWYVHVDWKIDPVHAAPWLQQIETRMRDELGKQ